MNLGGPVWHASGRGRTFAESKRIARTGLLDVGDASLGEWWEEGENGVVHLRRRLSAAEQEAYGVLHVRDIRGTREERIRLAVVMDARPELRGILPFAQPPR
jgi:hypothetical protein